MLKPSLVLLFLILLFMCRLGYQMLQILRYGVLLNCEQIERIDYEILSLTYKVLTTTQPSYLCDSYLSSTSSQHSFL